MGCSCCFPRLFLGLKLLDNQGYKGCSFWAPFFMLHGRFLRGFIVIRQARLEDYQAILGIYKAAREYMAATGNAQQWGTTKPVPSTVKADIELGQSFVGVDEDDTLHFVFACLEWEDPTYAKIDGSWPNDEPYLTIHRVASDGTMHSTFTQVIEFVKARAAQRGISNIRIDTHDDNATMQHCILKAGFTYCGTIYLENGDPRRAYQLVL